MKTFTKTLFTGAFFLLLSFNINAQGLWGMTSKGGDEDMGVIFKTDASGNNFSVVENFSIGRPGSNPGLLVDGNNGILYGMTDKGGQNDQGVIFKYDYVYDEYTVLYNFGENGETYNPDINSLVLSNNNKLYGYSKKNYNGSFDYGVLFKLDLSNNHFSEIHNFSMARPVGRLTLASDGNVYGCQAEVYNLNNNPNFGWIIGINTNSDVVFSVHEFDADAEGLPTEGVVEHGGVLYGTTSTNKTTFFKYDLSASKYTVLSSMLFDLEFKGSPVYLDGKLYGITGNGASDDYGGVYKYDIAADNFSFVYVFSKEGEVPEGNMILSKDGCLYGTTYNTRHNENGEGIFYKVSFDEISSGSLTVLYNYTHAFHSEYLTEAGNYGNIYITDRGDNDDLHVWVPASDTYKFKFEFTRYETGRYPKGSLSIDQDQTLTGFTTGGGRSDVGTEFKYDNTDSDTKYYSFYDGVSDINGKVTLFTQNNVPVELVLTKSGGDYNKGSIYNMDWVIYSFDGTNGAYPNGSLIKALNGKLYGTTTEGGNHDKGVVFEYDYQASPHVYTKLVDFDGTNGANPYGSLLEASDGRLYGTTSKGGDNDMGTIFYYNTSTGTYVRVFDKVADFNGTDGKYPLSDLVETEDGTLYGLTSEGGTNNCGTIFEYDMNTHALTVKYNFSSTSGKNPKGSLTIGKDGVLFGLTNSGGTYDKGVMFSFDPETGTYTKLMDFNGSNGAYPEYTTLLYVGITPDAKDLPDVTGDCEVSITDYPTATNSYGETVTGTTATVFPVTDQGTTIITWTYDDGRGNVTTQDQNIIIGIDNTVTVNENVLTANANGGYTYQWYQRSGSWTILLQGENDRSFTTENSGTYFVEISNGTCSARSDDVTVTVTGINDFGELGVSIYPNPVQDMLHIRNNNGDRLQISVYDIAGNKIKAVSSGSADIRINVDDWANGVYFIVLNNGKNSVTLKVLKK